MKYDWLTVDTGKGGYNNGYYPEISAMTDQMQLDGWEIISVQPILGRVHVGNPELDYCIVARKAVHT